MQIHRNSSAFRTTQRQLTERLQFTDEDTRDDAADRDALRHTLKEQRRTATVQEPKRPQTSEPSSHSIALWMVTQTPLRAATNSHGLPSSSAGSAAGATCRVHCGATRVDR